METKKDLQKKVFDLVEANDSLEAELRQYRGGAIIGIAATEVKRFEGLEEALVEARTQNEEYKSELIDQGKLIGKALDAIVNLTER